MEDITYNYVTITVEDIANILYGSEVGKRANDGTVTILKLEKQGVELKMGDRKDGECSERKNH